MMDTIIVIASGLVIFLSGILWERGAQARREALAAKESREALAAKADYYKFISAIRAHLKEGGQ